MVNIEIIKNSGRSQPGSASALGQRVSVQSLCPDHKKIII